MTSRNYEFLIFLGFIFITLGILILALNLDESATGYFFVFPFFFVGQPGPFGMLLILITVGITFVFLLQFIRFKTPFERLVKESSIICSYCYQELPQTADYCFRCGKPTSNQQDSHDADY